ncbi:MAG TPA: maleylpyruvate isomerase family mycothiol-dependent enzyme [Acidimicrobiales bacterium]|jgi:uncharacterized protein (TIGR03083 family)
MTLARTVVVPGMIAEYEAFADLLSGLSPAQWEAMSRCEDWRAADVAAHVVGQLADVAALRLEGLGTPEVTGRQVEERRGRSAADLAEELRTTIKAANDLVAAFDDDAYASEGPQGGSTLGFGLESLWFDTFLHADDILAASGQANRSTSGLAPSVSHIAQILTDQEWTPATIRLDGLDQFEVADGDLGNLISGDPKDFILVATGRTDSSLMGLDPSVNIYR